MERIGLEMGLDGKVAVITGASGAIGGHIATCLGAFGVRCALLCNTNKAQAEEIKSRIERSGSFAQVYSFTLVDCGAVRRCINTVYDMFHGLDILINCAGVYNQNLIQDVLLTDLQNAFNVNVVGPVNTMKNSICYLKEAPYGRIINIGSFAADVCLPGTAAYSMSKAGLVALTKVVAKEVAPYRITANVVQPGTFDSDVGMVSHFHRDVVDRLRRLTPIGRLGNLSEISSLVTFLCSPHSSYINGAVINVDGGI